MYVGSSNVNPFVMWAQRMIEFSEQGMPAATPVVKLSGQVIYVTPPSSNNKLMAGHELYTGKNKTLGNHSKSYDFFGGPATFDGEGKILYEHQDVTVEMECTLEFKPITASMIRQFPFPGTKYSLKDNRTLIGWPSVWRDGNDSNATFGKVDISDAPRWLQGADQFMGRLQDKSNVFFPARSLEVGAPTDIENGMRPGSTDTSAYWRECEMVMDL